VSRPEVGQLPRWRMAMPRRLERISWGWDVLRYSNCDESAGLSCFVIFLWYDYIIYYSLSSFSSLVYDVSSAQAAWILMQCSVGKEAKPAPIVQDSSQRRCLKYIEDLEIVEICWKWTMFQPFSTIFNMYNHV
jgi:hypothetical protein